MPKYEYTSVSEEWKAACSHLPCFSALRWHGYESTVREIKIGNHDVVVQLWKGTCQKAFGADSAPGGIGAEVGVYKHFGDGVPPRPVGRIPSFFETIRAALPIGHNSPFWLPWPELKTKLTFKLTHEGKEFFSAGAETGYWLAKWMNPESYERFKREPGVKVPLDPSRYDMSYTINGVEYHWNG